MAYKPLSCWQVGEIVKEVFQKEPSRGVNPDEVVALGAAIQVGAALCHISPNLSHVAMHCVWNF